MNTTEHHACKIVGLSGSLRSGSYTTMAVALALQGAKELKCETRLINLRDYQLVFCDGKDDESQFPKDVFRTVIVRPAGVQVIPRQSDRIEITGSFCFVAPALLDGYPPVDAQTGNSCP